MKAVPLPISVDISEVSERHFDVIVVGSGYGGGVAASKLARCGRTVAVLERGREIRPGAYPRNPAQASEEFQTTLSGDTIGKRSGMFDLRVFDDVNVLVGCGLGGTSLINANVAVEPEARVLETWPAPPEGDWKTALRPHYEEARRMLGSGPYPEGKTTPKLDAMQTIADALGETLHRPDINVTFADSHNAAGVWQSACVDCGDCVTGCNYGAKNTVLMNYLPDAHASGATLVTGAEVRSVSKGDTAEKSCWSLLVWPAADDKLRSPVTFTADVVILAAGTLGSTEILMRSRETLRLSDMLGQGFSGNGDTWSLGFNANLPDGAGGRRDVRAIGAGPHVVGPGPIEPEESAYRPGPCITGMIHVHDDDLAKTVMIEEGVLPGAFAAGYAVGLPGLATIESDPFRYGDMALRATDLVELGTNISENPLAIGETVYSGSVARTMPFLTFSHDAAAGRMDMRNGRVSIEWAKAGKDPAILHTETVLRDACDAIQAEYMPFLTSLEAFGNRTMVVHPLGGCIIGADATSGVVSTDCEVFDGSGGVHRGLFVMDGSVIPSALGANPHLTITAIAERAVERLINSRDWSMDRTPASPLMHTDDGDEANPVDLLDAAITEFQAISSAIDAKAYEVAVLLLRGFWRQVLSFVETLDEAGSGGKPKLPSVKKFIKYFGSDDALQTVTGPIAKQFLDLLVPLRDSVKESDPAGVVSVLEEKIGDFSPTASFREAMEGFVTTKGLDDPETDFDPHLLLGTSAHPCRIEAVLRTDAIQSLMTTPVGHAEICDGTFICDGLGGTFVFGGRFRFLALDEDAVDRWLVTYDGPLTGEDGTRLYFRGRKTLHHRKGSHWWRDLCDLNVDIRETEEHDAPLVARGRMQVSLENAIRQAALFEVKYTDLGDAPKRVWDKIKKAMADKSGVACRGKPKVENLPPLFESPEFRVLCAKAALLILDRRERADGPSPSDTVAAAFKARLMARAAGLVFRTYGGVYSYAANFPHRDLLDSPPIPSGLPEPECYFPEPEPGVRLKLTRYKDPLRKPDGLKGPLILANGFGVKASAFALPTVHRNVVEALVRDGFDVWLFDYRGSGDAAGSLTQFTIDDVARTDWPAAIDLVLDRTGADTVQALVHCVGSLSLFMAILAGETRVRSIVASQVGAHGIVNWFKNAQFDAEIGGFVANGLPETLWPVVDALGVDDDLTEMAKKGMPVVDVRSPTATYSDTSNAAMDALLWSVPHFADVPCKSPTCHRINFIFGPTYRHENLNQATHAYIEEMFGPVSSTPFLHLALMFDAGRLLSARINADGTVSPDGKTNYYDGHENLRIPIHFIAGAQNAEILPEATLRTIDWLRKVNGTPSLYSRHVYQGYGHMDCFIGRNAWTDIFPDLIRVLNKQYEDT